MGIIKFPGPGPFRLTAEYLAGNRGLFAKHGYDLASIRSEADLTKALELISAAEWAAVATRMVAAAKDLDLPQDEREFWAAIASGQPLEK